MNSTEAEQGGREFSFILPVYNVEEYLEDAVGSVLGQKDYDFSRLEIFSREGEEIQFHRVPSNGSGVS